MKSEWVEKNRPPLFDSFLMSVVWGVLRKEVLVYSSTLVPLLLPVILGEGNAIFSLNILFAILWAVVTAIWTTNEFVPLYATLPVLSAALPTLIARFKGLPNPSYGKSLTLTSSVNRRESIVDYIRSSTMLITIIASLAYHSNQVELVACFKAAWVEPCVAGFLFMAKHTWSTHSSMHSICASELDMAVG